MYVVQYDSYGTKITVELAWWLLMDGRLYMFTARQHLQALLLTQNS